MRRSLSRVALACCLLSIGSAGQAADYIFSFSTDLTDPNVTNGVPGTVTGRILGLPEDGTGSALSILIDSYSPDGSLGLPVDAVNWFSQFENSFTVDGGIIVAALFQADDDFTPGEFSRLYIGVDIYDSGLTNYASLGSNNAESVWNNQGLAGITFTRIGGEVPEPATWALMLLGFGAVGWSMRMRRAPARIARA